MSAADEATATDIRTVTGLIDASAATDQGLPRSLDPHGRLDWMRGGWGRWPDGR